MDELRFGVKWINHYKCITYITPDGQHLRDNRLLDDKCSKTNMEELFAYGYYQTKDQQSDRTDNRGNAQTVFSGDAKDNGRQAGLNRVFNQGQIIEADELIERVASQGDNSNGERAESQESDAVEVQTKMGSGWGDIAIDALFLAADITMIGETDNNKKQKPKFVRERKRGQKKK